MPTPTLKPCMVVFFPCDLVINYQMVKLGTEHAKLVRYVFQCRLQFEVLSVETRVKRVDHLVFPCLPDSSIEPFDRV
jgi:hypothetical protein